MLLALLALALDAQASAIPHYVATNSPSPGSPYATWASAAHTIQEAVDVALIGEDVIVTDGVYAVGGRLTPGDPAFTQTNRVLATTAVLLKSFAE